MEQGQQELRFELKHDSTPTQGELRELELKLSRLSDEHLRIETVHCDAVAAEPFSATVIGAFLVGAAASAFVSWIASMIEQERVRNANREVLQAIVLHELAKAERGRCKISDVQDMEGYTRFHIDCSDGEAMHIDIANNGHLLT